MTEQLLNDAPLDLSLIGGRRGLLTKGGLGAVALGALATGIGLPGTAEAAVTFDDPTILNFALNLEYLEAEFYQRGVFGTPLPSSLTYGNGTQGKVVGGRKLPFQTKYIGQALAEIATDELNHVKFLRSALGPAHTQAEPAINLTQSFLTIGAAIGLPGFDPFHDELSFLLGAFIFEDVGVTAYNGAAPLISSKTYLGAAASILAVEAYHAATLRTLVLELGGATYANAISALRGAASAAAPNGAADDQGVFVDGKVNIVPTDSSSLAFARTPAEVLNVVYLSPTGTPGGFFPNGVNLPSS